jgi:hypothetical protein
MPDSTNASATLSTLIGVDVPAYFINGTHHPAPPRGKIFCIGLPKTGTCSLDMALMKLGFKTWHNPAKLKVSRQFDGTFDFRAGLQGIDAVLNSFERIYPVLDEKFPDSRFILTVRDKEKWLRSSRAHFKKPQAKQPKGGKLTRCNLNRIDVYGCFRYNRTQFEFIFDSHIRNVLQYFKDKPEKLLVLDLCDMPPVVSWHNLCNFVGKPLPTNTSKFPHRNARVTPVTQ